jgi:hypothetical protein
MFYVLIFSLAAVILIVAFFAAVSRRRRTMRGEDVALGAGGADTAHVAHGTHPSETARRDCKAKRSQSQHDRRKRH